MNRKRSADDVALHIKNSQKKRKLSGSNLPVPFLPHIPLTSPTHAYNGQKHTLPELPEILDKSLEDVAFTHQGTLPRISPEDANLSYERLEFLGDAYIEVISSTIIFHRYPLYSAGKLSQKRQAMVNNETLADFSLAYGFDKRARLPKNFPMASGNDQRKSWTKVMGDIFEAYVAAVVLSDSENGFSTVESWLSKLWAPMLSGGNDQKVDMKAKVQLATKIMGKGVKILYLDEGKPEVFEKEGQILFQVGAYITGWGWQKQHLGSGKGWNKNEAGNMAATQALANPLTAQIAAVKQDFDLKTAQEKDDQNVNTNAKVQLASKIGGNGVKILYLDEELQDVFTEEGQMLFQVGAYVRGRGWQKERLGFGQGLNINEAGDMAATQALANPLTAQIAAAKQDLDLKTAQERVENAKAQLATKIMGKNVKIFYLDEDSFTEEGQTLFQIGAYITGWGWENEHLGSGKGRSKTEAGNVAATQALANPLTAQIVAVKQDFDLKTARERKDQRSLANGSKA